MSTKKEKYLESAQKFILKGQIDRAIKDYEQVVALDPNDLRNRQRLAELLVRVNRKIEAITHYEAIGKYYADNAYYLKAIAVYKQIQKLSPEELKTSLTLASLNEKQGLTGNALAEYGLVCKQYEKAGNRKEVLGILEKMLEIDPENPATQVKFAEAHYTAGQVDKAYEEFTHLALLLQKQGDEAAFNRICDRIQQLFPDKGEFIMDLVATQIEKGHAAEAIPCLQAIIRKDTANLKAWRLLTYAYRSRRETENLKLAYRHMSRLFPDDAAVWEGMVRCFLDEGDVEGALELLQSYAPRFIANGDTESPELLYRAVLELAPDETRALEGLSNLYEATRASAKLAEVSARLAALSRAQKPQPEPPPAAPDLSPSPATPAVATPGQPEQAVVWEEEIDLSLLEEAGLHELPLADEVGAMPEPAAEETPAGEIVAEAAVSATPARAEGAIPADNATAHVELDFGNDVSGTDWLNETPEEQASGGESLGEGHLPTPGEPSLPDTELPALDDDEFFNLGEELLAEGFDEEPLAAGQHGKQSLEGLFTESRKRPHQLVDEGDTETHYNLGIAYMEMGLFDDAISEFRAAVVDPHRKVDCLTLQGVCYRDKGDIDMAEQVFHAGIALEGLAPEGLLSLKYELALLYETAGRRDEALRTYREVQAVKPGFRDTPQKLAELQGEEDAGELEELELVEELEGEDIELER